MRSKGKMVGWGVALVAAAAVTTTIAVHPGFGSPNATEAKSAATGTSLSSAQMHSVLVPLSAQPASESVRTMTLKEAAEAFPLPPDNMYEPKACLSYVYDVVGSFSALDGWISFGTRSATGKKFMQFVVNIPKGADVAAIEASAARCTSGTVTLEGKVKGDISLTKSRAPQIAGAQSVSIATRLQFHETAGTEGAEILARNLAMVASGADFNAQQTLTNVGDFAANGNTLVAVEESDQATADQIASAMAQNVNAASGH
jgi:hypothetical protein